MNSLLSVVGRRLSFRWRTSTNCRKEKVNMHIYDFKGQFLWKSWIAQSHRRAANFVDAFSCWHLSKQENLRVAIFFLLSTITLAQSIQDAIWQWKMNFICKRISLKQACHTRRSQAATANFRSGNQNFLWRYNPGSFRFPFLQRNRLDCVFKLLHIILFILMRFSLHFRLLCGLAIDKRN